MIKLKQLQNGRPPMLWSQDLRVDQENEPYIGFIQENSIENSIQDSPSYILITYGLCSTTLAYPK